LLPGLIAARCPAYTCLRAHLVAPVLAAPVFSALHEIARGRAKGVVGSAERVDASVAVVVEADVQPDLRHPLGVAHGAGPGAAHLGWVAPAALGDDEPIAQLLPPTGAPPRLTPGQCGERRDDWPHVVLLHVRVAIGGLDPPQTEHDRALDPKILFDAGKEACVFLRLLLAGNDAPVGDA